MEALQAQKVSVVSMREGFDLATSAGKFMLTMLAAVAELERENIKARQMAGIERARAEGKNLGRAKVINDAEVRQWRQANSASIKAIANADASATIDIAHANLSKTNTAIAATLSGLTGTVSAGDVTKLESAIQNVSSQLSKLGTGAKALDTHLTNVMKLQDTLDAGVGNLVDADLAKESAKLQALQTKQQLGVQALSIANQSSGILLGLFR